MARKIHFTLEGLDVQAYLKDFIRKVYQHPLIHVSHDAVITNVSGYVGSFITTVKSEGRIREIHHGAAILATGADEYKPTEYLYGEDDKVLTQLELEEWIAGEEKKLMSSQTLVMIQCVGCREEGRNYCARVCCSQAVKNALKLKEIKPEMDIYILFRDMRTYGFTEDYYREAAEKDVRFIRWKPDNKPQVESTAAGGKPVIRITVPDPVLRQTLLLEADLLVLSAAVVPSAVSQETARMFKTPLSPDGFYQEAHVKLRPVDFAAEGVFTCGTAHYPKHISETIGQAYGAAGRAATLLSQDTVTASGAVCEVKEQDCVTCGACITACTYGAIEFRDTPKGKKAWVNPILCKGDGLCNAKCPTSAISLKHYTDEEVFGQIDAAIVHPAEVKSGNGGRK
jgi:heterodisulfide reductase subunit A